MQLPGLIVFSLMLVPACNSKGEKWNLTVSRNITAEKGSNITIPCNFTYPSKHHTDNVSVYWKKWGQSLCSKNDKDTNAFIYHPNELCVVEKYRRRTLLEGDKARGSCSLKILNITSNELDIYVRISVKGDNYSFKGNSVSIFVKGSGYEAVTSNPDSFSSFTLEDTTMEVILNTSTTMYLAIFIPLATLVIILLVAGISIIAKRRRSQTLTREESGYYVNFSRASSSPPSESCSKKDVNCPQPKVIDDPVYANVQNPTGQMNQNMDTTDNIYVNVDYSK
ncbi:uncharacterized protein LOC114448709 [Parambassis ranga]|uniref:Uncharacterized protein LOC114448709 n=1 Tax=Parambassis ranga TaxID=210632 RepID=A0A6P7JXG3_9TELE|nr:uncharacterized protein LOC114448709 [Parambassis ranga]